MVLVKNRQGRRQWREHLKRWSESGVSQAEYCREHGIKVTTFSGWKKRLRWPMPQSTKPQSKLVEVPWEVVQDVEHTPARAFKSQEMVLQVGAYRVTLQEEFSAVALTRLLAVLQGS